LKINDPAKQICSDCLTASLEKRGGVSCCILCNWDSENCDEEIEETFETDVEPFGTAFNRTNAMNADRFNSTLARLDSHKLLHEHRTTFSDFAKVNPSMAAKLRDKPYEIDLTSNLLFRLQDGYITKIHLSEIDKKADFHKRQVRQSILNGFDNRSGNSQWKQLVKKGQELVTQYNISMTDEALLATYRFYLKLALIITETLKAAGPTHKYKLPTIAHTIFYYTLLRFGKSKMAIAKAAKPNLQFDLGLFNAVTKISNIANSEPDLSTEFIEVKESKAFSGGRQN